MPWFKVSDDQPSRATTSRIPRAHRLRAMGLWAMAGAWCAQQLTDGHVPAYMLDELAGSDEDAQWLVTAGIWEAADDGWQFTEWAPEQPLREAVLADREKRAAKMRDWRSRNTVRNPPTDPATSAPTNAVTDPSVKHVPSQPVPSQPSTSDEVEHVHAKRERDEQIVDEFTEQFWPVFPRKQAKADALKAFKAARKTTDLEPILIGVRAYALLAAGGDKAHVKLPAGWLRDRRWEDEDQVPIDAATAHRLTRDEQNLAVVARLAAQERDAMGYERHQRRATRDEQNFALVAQMAAEARGPDGAWSDCGPGHHLWTVDGTCANCLARRDPELPDGNDF